MKDHGIGLRKAVTGVHFIPTYDARGDRYGSLNVADIVRLYVNEPQVSKWEIMAELRSGKNIRVSEGTYQSREVAIDTVDSMTRRW